MVEESLKFFFLSPGCQKPLSWIQIWNRIEKKCWIRILMETYADPKHWYRTFLVRQVPVPTVPGYLGTVPTYRLLQVPTIWTWITKVVMYVVYSPTLLVPSVQVLIFVDLIFLSQGTHTYQYCGCGSKIIFSGSYFR